MRPPSGVQKPSTSPRVGPSPTAAGMPGTPKKVCTNCLSQFIGNHESLKLVEDISTITAQFYRSISMLNILVD